MGQVPVAITGMSSPHSEGLVRRRPPWLRPPGNTYSLCNGSSEEPHPGPSSEFCPSSSSLSSVLSSFWDVASPFTGAERSGRRKAHGTP